MTSPQQQPHPIPAQVQDDLDACTQTAVEAAVALLEKNGEFFPLAVHLACPSQGPRVSMAFDDTWGEHPPPQAVLDLLYHVARHHQPPLLAAAFAADVRLRDGGDAIRVEADHASGVSLLWQFPYRRSRLRRRLTLGEPLLHWGVDRHL